MATLKQILKKHGFQLFNAANYREQWKLKADRKWAGKSYVSLVTASYYRHASEVQVMLSGKKKSIWFGYNEKTHAPNAPSAEQLARFEELVIQCKEAAIHEEANPAPKAPRKPAPPRPTLTDTEKFDNSVYRFLGDFYVCGYIGKEDRNRLYYVKAGKYIRVEDYDSIMCYAAIRESTFAEYKLPFTLATFEEWLQSQGIPKKAQKRVKRFTSYSPYD